jgi:molybdopterin-guanine dinucleotide biosynthesis protein A
LSAASRRVVGFAFAGGASRRMGEDKALLPWRGTSLLDHAVSRLGQVAASVGILSGGSVRYHDRGLPVIVDATAGAGALGGVCAALAAHRTSAGLFLAIDLPLVPASLLARLVEASADVDAVVPVTPRGAEPLCAVYGPACLDPIRSALARGDFKMTAFWPDVRVRTLGVEELSAFGDPERLFLNVNAREDYERALRLDGGGAERG